MAISFVEVNATLASTETEVTEYDGAVSALEDARTALGSAQDVVSTAQESVTAAIDTEGQEKADVVAGITTAVSQLTAILAELQN